MPKKKDARGKKKSTIKNISKEDIEFLKEKTNFDESDIKLWFEEFMKVREGFKRESQCVEFLKVGTTSRVTN